MLVGLFLLPLAPRAVDRQVAYGNESRETLRAANNYALSLINLQRYAEAKALLRKTVPVARRVCRDCDENTLRLRWNYARALYEDGATLDDPDHREAVTTLEDTARTARRVLGGEHPLTVDIDACLRHARAVLRAREASRA